MKKDEAHPKVATSGSPATNGTPAVDARRPYRAPNLTVHGDVRSLTLGPSPGIGESGLPLILRAGTRSRPPMGPPG